MARRRTPRTESLRRRTETRTPRKTLVLFCEGERSEPDYFEALKREPQVRELAAVDVRIDEDSAGSDPLTLVRAAICARERAQGAEGEIDEFWCVFDVEWKTYRRNHPTLMEAVRLAHDNDIRLAISNPCFELWLVLHFKTWTRWLNNTDARRERRACDGQADKGVAGALYMPKRSVAAKRAKALDAKHAGDGTPFPDDNPSSGVFRIIESVSGAI
jgi:hypothetical protein